MTQAQKAIRLPLPKEGTGLHTISFDGDGCLWEPTWPSPKIGRANPRAVKALLEYRRLGYEIIVFTSRPASHLQAIRQWLFDNDLDSEVYDIVTGKPRAAMYIDDRAVTFPEAFERLEEAPEMDLPRGRRTPRVYEPEEDEYPIDDTPRAVSANPLVMHDIICREIDSDHRYIAGDHTPGQTCQLGYGRR